MFVLAMVCAVAQAATPQPARLKLAIPAVHAEVGVPQGSANLLSELLTNDIQKSNRYEVFNAADITALVGLAKEKQLVGCDEDHCLMEIGNALGSDQLLWASVGRIGNLRVIALKLIDIKASKVVRRVSETVDSDEALVDAGHRLVAELLDLPRPGSRSIRPIVGYSVLGVAGAAAVVGVVFGLSAQRGVAQFKAAPFNESLAQTAEGNARIADICYGGAIVAAGVAAFLLLTGHDAPPASSGGTP